MNSYANDFNNINRLYYNELKKFKPLDKNKEISLFLKYKNNNDISARNELITSNLKFVVDIAKRYKGHGLSFGDLVSEGNIGLLKAIDRFDEKKDTKIISYGVWWIRQTIKEAIAKKNNIQADDLPEDHEKQVNDDDLYNHQDENEFNSLFENDDYYTNSSNVEIVNKLLDSLDEREKEIIISYFGLYDNDQLTLEEIGIKYDLTKERVRQIKEVALKKLRSNALIIDDKYLIK